MAIAFAIDDCVDIDHILAFAFLHGFDGNGDSVRNFVLEVNKHSFTDKFRNDCSFRLVGYGIVRKIMGTFLRIFFKFIGKDIDSVFFECGNRNYLIEGILFGKHCDFRKHFLFVFKSIDFVDAKNCRKVESLEAFDKVTFRLGDFAFGFNNKNCNINISDGIANLFYHEIRKFCLRFMKTGGIDENELGKSFCKDTGDTGSGGLGFCGNCRNFFADKRVKKRAFAYVRSSYYCYESGFCFKIFIIH